ncbi:MAG: transposase, partial [Terriglobales bacterium]
GRYTHRIALTNNRLVSLDDQTVRFRYQDYAAGNRRKVMALDAPEFIRRYLAHVLPKGFMRIRHYGLNGNRAKRHKLAQARAALDCPPPAPVRPAPETIEAFWLRIAHLDIHQCPHCASGPMRRIGALLPRAHAPPP